MSILSPLPRTEDAVELIDGPVPFADLSECLADLARINMLFGGTWVTLTHVKQLLSRLPIGQAVTVVDVGAGAGDIPRALVRWARRTGRPIRVFALDRDFATLRVAGRFLGSYPEITLVQGDALALPVRAGSVDITISALTLHHLNREEAVRYLRELDTAARLGIVVNDLVRSRVAYVLVWLTTRVLARSRIARHDGPLSVLRAYTPDEARQLCEQAGLCNVEVMHYVTLLRQCAIRRGPRSSG